MIIASRIRGHVHASSATFDSPALGGPRSGAAAVPGHSPLPKRGVPTRSVPNAKRVALLRKRLAERPRPALRTALLSFDTQAVVPLLLLALALSAFVPALRFELQTSSDQVAVETSATMISAIAAILFLDRFWRHLRLRNLLLAGGLAVIAGSNLGAGLLLAGNLVLAGHSVAWIVLGGRIAGWLLITGSVIVPDRRLERPTPAALRAILLRAGAIAVPVALVVALNAHTTSYDTLHSGPLGNPTAMLVAQILLALLTGVAAVVLRREAGHAGSPAVRLLALACAFAAAAALAGCATPSFYAARVGVADVLRLGWLVALFACVCVEWSLDERHAPAHALAHERRRMAADVHDLIMQDLSFALANARTLVDDPARATQASTVVLAGERALAGARDVISGLNESGSEPIAEAIEASVRAAARHTPLRFDATGASTSPGPDQPTRQALVHIAREAVTNAVKHAGASTIEVVIAHPDEWLLTVRDDGRGLDLARGSEGAEFDPDSFGLLSMQRHASALGGTLHVGRADGGGTIVKASLP